jgi:rubrerythrin
MPQQAQAPAVPLCYFKNTSAIDAIVLSVSAASSGATSAVSVLSATVESNKQLAIASQNTLGVELATKANSATVSTLATTVESNKQLAITTSAQLASDMATKANSSAVAQVASDLVSANAVHVTTQATLATSIATKYASSDAVARIVQEKKFYDAYKAAVFLAGADGVTEFDYSML